MKPGTTLLAIALGCVFVLPVQASDLSDLVLTIQADNGRQGSGEILIFQEDGWWEGDTFNWQADTDMDITDDEGVVIGTFLQASFAQYVVPSSGARSDPQVNLGFAMQAGEDLTTFTVKSALLTVDPAYVNPDARASVGITVSDSYIDGAELAGVGPTGGSYLAQYNGFVPDGTTFDESISGIVVTEPFGTEDASSDTLWQPVADTINDMSAQIAFTLTAGDFASGTSTYQITPEPASLLLLVAALALVRRR